MIDPRRELPEVERKEAARKLALTAAKYVEEKQTTGLFAAAQNRRGADTKRLAQTVDVRRLLQGSDAERVH
jgi:hypothetical protein